MRLGKTLYLSNANNPSTRADLAVHRSTDDVRPPADASARLWLLQKALTPDRSVS